MRILWLAPRNIHLEPIVCGLCGLDRHEIVMHWLNEHGSPCDRPILNAADGGHFDMIVYTGENGGPHVPTTDTLLRLRSKAPTVFICHDASDITWKRFLDEYMDRDVFTTIVSIDGNVSWSRRPQDITALTPHDPRFYQ